MTTQTVHIHTFDYGASLTSATLRTVSADTLVATADSVNEVTADSGLYAAVFGETAVIAAGEYRLRAVVGGQSINRYVTLAGTDGEIVEARNERAAVLDSTSVTAVQNGLATQSNVNNVGTAVVAVGTLIGTPAGASVSADVASVKSDTSSLISRLTANAATAIQNLFHMITGTGASSKYTVAALENAPSSTGGGGGDATAANQTLILNKLDTITGEQLAAITVEPGTIGNFPSTLIIGDSYDTDTGWIKIAVTDENGDPITALGNLNFDDATVSFVAFRPNDSATIVGTCEFIDGGSETYVKLTLTSAETNKGLPEYTYEGRLKFAWTGGKQKTYKTTPFKFIANP